jgi:pimeloyl-ACP methyl ester carboxylesterase
LLHVKHVALAYEQAEGHGRNPGPGTTATATTIPATGHDLHLEQPEALHAVLTDFLDHLA